MLWLFRFHLQPDLDQAWPKLGWLFDRTKRLAKMRDRGLSKIGKAKQCLVRRFAHLSDSLQASREQRVLYPRWESNFTGWCLIRKLWRWLKLAHFFAFSPISTMWRMAANIVAINGAEAPLTSYRKATGERAKAASPGLVIQQFRGCRRWRADR
jgi:hypothetical protein